MQHGKDITWEQFTSLKRGDQGAFGLVFERYHAILYRYALSISENQEEAQEVVQDSFVTLFRKTHELAGPDSIYPFLFVLTKRGLGQRFRRKIIETRYNDYLKAHWQESSRDTEEKIGVRDLRRAIDQALDSLPSRQAEVFRLHRFSQLSYEEIAALTGRSRHTIKNQCISASQKLKLRLEKMFHFFF